MGDKIGNTEFFCKIRAFQKHPYPFCPVICRDQTQGQLTIIKIPDFSATPATPECTDGNPVFFSCRQNRFCCLLIVDNLPLPAYQLTALHAHRTDFRKFFVNVCVRFHTDDHSYPHMFPPACSQIYISFFSRRYSFAASHSSSACSTDFTPS